MSTDTTGSGDLPATPPATLPAALPGWQVRPNLRHERLVWLAAKPELERIHRKWWHQLVRVSRARMDARRRGWRPETTEHEALSDSLRTASIVVDDLAGRFHPTEREVLLRTGVLPDWFWTTYRADFKGAKRR